MTSKKKNIVNEPPEVYEVTPKNNSVQEEPHPVLVKLIEKSKKDLEEGKGIPHEVVMKRIKEKFPFLK